MKKILLFTSLLLVAGGSWAFYPKTTEPAGYMMLRSQLVPAGFGGGKVVFTVFPVDGPAQYEEVPIKIGSVDKALAAGETLRTTELKKLNEYRNNGWRLAEVMQSGTETIYLMERQ